jgi:deoxyribodipyrimidine photolyase-related protein
MKTLRVILTDQLSIYISSLAGGNKEHDIILLCELMEDASYVKHHKKKIAFLFSAMRHFAILLSSQAYIVDYVKINDKDNTGSLKQEVKRALQRHNIDKIVITHPGEFRILQDVKTWEGYFDIPVEIKLDSRFLCSSEEFALWISSQKQPRMEYFYRYMRQKYSILMDNKNPIGGKWNYDIENRKPASDRIYVPRPYHFKPDEITQEVMDLVAERFSDHFGNLEPFYFAVTREQALLVLDHFINERLAYFGEYQDAMLEGQPWLYHSHISFYLNSGLLLPYECVKAAEDAYYKGKVPLNSAEGFIRQIIGWREYVRGIYWLKMPDYKENNFLNALRRLPEFYWTGNTKMNCLKQCITQTKEYAYAHHIQRLMVLGNFALLAGISPAYVNEWFLIVYADAYEWVELPNVTGMILYADGGYLASKPYAAGGSYISKMSNYCTKCSYKVGEKSGNAACPFNYLYWHFLATNRELLASNHRISMIYKTYDKMAEEKKIAITRDSNRFLKMIENNELV